MPRITAAALLALLLCAPAQAQMAIPVASCGTIAASLTPTVPHALYMDQATGRLCTSGSGAPPYQMTAASPMQSQLAVATTPATAPTVPSGTLAFTVCLRPGAASSINYTIDGSAPVTGATGNGRQLTAGQCVGYNGNALANAFRAVGSTGATAIDVEYTK